MEMEAGEFCGNASRAYGFLLAKQQGLSGCRSMQLSVSGCDHPITVTVDMDAGTAEAEMPLPKFVRPVDAPATGTLVHLGGIAHLVVQDVPPSREFFAQAEPLFAADPALDAYGVCFVEGGPYDAAGEGTGGGNTGVRGQLRQRYAGLRSGHEPGQGRHIFRLPAAAGPEQSTPP